MEDNAAHVVPVIEKSAVDQGLSPKGPRLT